MTPALESAIAGTAPSRSPALRFVGNAWRRLTLRQFAMSIAIGFGLGSVQGIGAALWQTRMGWWESYVACAMSGVALGIAFLLCIVVASDVQTRRMPRWVPYSVATTLAVVLATLFDMLVVWLIQSVADGGMNSWPGQNLRLGILLWLNIPPTLLMCYLAALGYLQYRDSVSRADALRSVQLERAMLARRTYVARLQVMQARVEPQFLFDTLGHVEKLYEDDPQLAGQMLDDLIDYLRAALPGLTSTHSSLGVEMTLAGAWLRIMRIGMRGRLTCTVAYPESARHARMPPMVLLPLVSDAVQSAMASMRNVETIAIDATATDQRLRIALRASACAMGANAGESTAVQVRERLAAVYGPQASLNLRADAVDGTWAMMEMPYEQGVRPTRDAGVESITTS